MRIMLVSLIAAVLGSGVGCTTVQKSQVAFNSRYLAEIGVAGVPPAPRYSIDEFFKTARITAFAFRPDGEAVYCIKHDDEVPNIFMYDLVDKQMEQITRFSDPVKSYRLDPQERYIYIQKDRGGNEAYDILRLNLDSGVIDELVSAGEGESCYLGSVSSSGDALYFVQTDRDRSQSVIKAVDVETGEISTVLSMDSAYLGISSLDAEQALLVFTRTIENNECHLGLYDLENETVEFVEQQPDTRSELGQLVDGTLYYLSNRDSNTQRIWTYDLESKQRALLDPQPGWSIDSFEICGRGYNRATVVYTHWDEDSNTKVYDGVFGTERELPVDVEEIYGIVLNDVDPSQQILIQQQNGQPLQYYISGTAGFELMYDANQSRISSDEFARTMMIFVRSHDGLMIPTVLVIPNGTDAAHRQPVLFWIHGGPEDHVPVEYSGIMQYLANNGYIVVAPNVRGSSGLGKSYRMLDNGDWGGKHIGDIVAVAEFMEECDFVQSENMFIMGGSFGGFSVVSLIEQYPRIFNAAINMFGLIELATFVESWPEGMQQYWLKELGEDPRKSEEFNRQVSPLYHVDQIEIPLQIHQGVNDPRVPQAQSDMLVERLEALGKPVEYYLYPEAGHGFTSFNDHRLCYERILRFCDEHRYKAPEQDWMERVVSE